MGIDSVIVGFHYASIYGQLVCSWHACTYTYTCSVKMYTYMTVRVEVEASNKEHSEQTSHMYGI